jgi:hypothetical protein
MGGLITEREEPGAGRYDTTIATVTASGLLPLAQGVCVALSALGFLGRRRAVHAMGTACFPE